LDTLGVIYLIFLGHLPHLTFHPTNLCNWPAAKAVAFHLIKATHQWTSHVYNAETASITLH